MKEQYFTTSAALALVAIFFLFSCKDQTMKRGYTGKDLSKEVMITRDAKSKTTSFKILNNNKWKLFAGNSVETIDLTTPILEGDTEGAFLIDVEAKSRTYFQVVTPSGSAILAESHLPMAGGYNFRDLGGFRTQDGRYTKWGKIFRSDDLNHLTDEDLEYLSSIPLVSIVDFRTQDEMNVAPDKNPLSLKNNYSLTISPGNISAFADLVKKSEVEMKEIMMQLNECLITDSASVDSYKKFFALLQSDEELPLMFHCSAGKDRTGMAAALILYALGVDENTILDDYMTSNDYLGDKYAPLKASNPNIIPLLEVDRKYLEAGLARIKQNYGSIDKFLTDVLSVDIATMQQKYLY